MRMVIAIIQPTKLNAVKTALARCGVERMTVCDAQGYGRQRGHSAVYRGVQCKTNLLRKVKLEIVVNDDFLDRTIEAISTASRTGPGGEIGDGKILVVPVDEAVRISETTRGPGAV
ncbi:MAG: P-II family nitrogen regulator [Pirellulales bacterium]